MNNNPPVTIAVFSDVHGNLPALEAVLKDLRSRRPDYILCAGDLVGYGPFPGQVVDLIAGQDVLTVQGNYDDAVANFRLVCGCDYKSDRAREVGEHSILFAKENTSVDQKAYLASLPRQLFLWQDARGTCSGNQPPFLKVPAPAVGYHGEVAVTAQPQQWPRARFATGWSLQLVHGSPRRLNEYLRLETTDSALEEIAGFTPADILVFGHTHQCFHRLVQGVHFINVGSAGKPKLGNPNPCYAWIEIAGVVKVDFIEVPYDFRVTANAMADQKIPAELIEIIRTGKD